MAKSKNKIRVNFNGSNASSVTGSRLIGQKLSISRNLNLSVDVVVNTAVDIRLK